MTARSYGAFDRLIVGLDTLTGANTLDVATIGIDQALLTSNISLLTDAYRRVHLELQIWNGIKFDGIRADGSFGSCNIPSFLFYKCLTKIFSGQHEGILYNGNYGVCLVPVMKMSLTSVAVKERTSMSTWTFIQPLSDLLSTSANDVLVLEIESAGTMLAAGSDSQNTFATLFEGNRWMIFRNILTGVLHWDLVSFLLYASRRPFSY
jgi:hypothetical protein